MYEWTEPYEDEYIRHRIEELWQAQKVAVEHDKVLVSSYEQFWLPVLNDLPAVEYIGGQITARHTEHLSLLPAHPFMAPYGSRLPKEPRFLQP